MNLYITSTVPEISARELCDHYITDETLVNTIKLITNCIRVYYPEHKQDLDACGIYGIDRTMVNHPCGVWVRESPVHIYWLTRYIFELERIRIKSGLQPHEGMHVLREAIRFKELDPLEFTLKFPPYGRYNYTVPFLVMPIEYQVEYGEREWPKKHVKDMYRGKSWLHVEHAYKMYMPSQVYKDGKVPTWAINGNPEWLDATYAI